MSISKKGNSYVELPEELRTTNLKDAKMEVSITLTLGKKLERSTTKAAEKFIAKEMKMISKDFKRFIEKRCSKELGIDFKVDD